MRTLKATAVITVLAFATSLGIASPVSAASNPYDYTVCGPGYYLVSGGVIDVRTAGGTRYAQMYVTWNSSSKMNCVVAIKRRYVGTRTEMTVTVQADHSEGSYDKGKFKYYGGPVYDIAPNTCITVSTRMWNPSRTTNAYASDHGWCG